MSKVLSIIFYVVSGFFFYMICLLSFIGGPAGHAKVTMMAIFSIPAAISLLIGLAITRFKKAERDSGIVLLSGAGTNAFIIFALICVFNDPGFMEMFPETPTNLFSDYLTGLLCTAFIGVIGILLILRSKADAGPQID